jgi:hypothetical protein
MDPHIARRIDHDSAARPRRNDTSLTSPVTRRLTPVGKATSIAPAIAGSLDGVDGSGPCNRGGSGAIDTGKKPVSSPSRNCLRHVQAVRC